MAASGRQLIPTSTFDNRVHQAAVTAQGLVSGPFLSQSRRSLCAVNVPSTPRVALAKLVAATLDGTLDGLCERFEVRLLSAFGSATRDGETPPKDLDIGVSFQRKNYGLHGSPSVESQLA
jgi:hypothetical protein